MPKGKKSKKSEYDFGEQTTVTIWRPGNQDEREAERVLAVERNAAVELGERLAKELAELEARLETPSPADEESDPGVLEEEDIEAVRALITEATVHLESQTKELDVLVRKLAKEQKKRRIRVTIGAASRWGRWKQVRRQEEAIVLRHKMQKDRWFELHASDPPEEGEEKEPHNPTLLELSEVDLTEEEAISFLFMTQGANIEGAIIGEPEGWTPPEDVQDWVEVRDYIFEPLLNATFEYNPHWRPEFLGMPTEEPEKNVSEPG